MMMMIAVMLFMSRIEIVSSRCQYCKFVARHCDDDISMAENISVCDANNKIIQSDLFCDDSECECGGDFQCVSMEIGCQNILIHKNAKRCVSPASIDFRMERCAADVDKTKQLEKDWIHFNNHHKCQSRDCKATREFAMCHEMECGHMIIAWKDENAYHFIIDGSRSKDMAAGEFHFTVPYDSATSQISCSAITSKIRPNCYSIQSRNEYKGKCDGMYYEVNLLDTDDEKLSNQPWRVIIAVCASVGLATLSVLVAIVVHYRNRKQGTTDDTVLEASITTPPVTTTASNTHLRQRTTPPVENQTEHLIPNEA